MIFNNEYDKKHINKEIQELPEEGFWRFIWNETQLLLTDGDSSLLHENINDLKKIKKKYNL